jgi:hypothetical protein
LLLSSCLVPLSHRYRRHRRFRCSLLTVVFPAVATAAAAAAAATPHHGRFRCSLLIVVSPAVATAAAAAAATPHLRRFCCSLLIVVSPTVATAAAAAAATRYRRRRYSLSPPPLFLLLFVDCCLPRRCHCCRRYLLSPRHVDTRYLCMNAINRICNKRTVASD